MSKRIFFCLLASVLSILLKRSIDIYVIIISITIVIYLLIKDRKCLLYLLPFIIFFTLIPSFDTPSINTSVSEEMRIESVKTNYYIIKSDSDKFICYDDYEFNQYEKIYVKGTTSLLKSNLSESISSFNDYLNSQGIYYELKISSYTVISSGDTFKVKIKNYLTSNLTTDSANMISLLLLADKSNLTDFYDRLVDLSVVQLFVISGFHLNIICALLDKMFKKKKDNLIVPFLLIPYLYLVNFTIPILRAFLFILGNRIIARYKLNLSRIDLLSIIAISFLIYDYHLIFNLSYQLSFLVCFVIEELNTNKNNSIGYKYIIRPLIIQLSVMPLIMNINYQIAPLSFILNTLLAYPITILYLLSFVTALFKFTDALYYPFVNGIDCIIDMFNDYNLIYITGKPFIPFVILLYLALIIYIYFIKINHKKYQYILAFLVLIISILNCTYYDLFSVDSVAFINVNQGDATLITSNHNKNAVLIDTGGSLYYDVATTKLIPYLKSKAIRDIDLVIITHEDYDHYGALESLQKNYTVKKVVMGYENEYMSYEDLVFQNINHYYSTTSEDNEKSAVIYFKHVDRSFLVMGDAPISIEKKIMKDYELDIDIIRVGHHGSKTSSSNEFIKFYKPTYAIISVGTNYYGHPNKEVLNILKSNGVLYYRTDNDGSIIVTSKDIKINV